MKNVKLKTGISSIVPVDKNRFEALTRMVEPYYPDGEKTIYPLAVCPQCDNPVEIIGFYKEISKKPYARHYPHSVTKLANYEQIEYENCPYHDKRKIIPQNALLPTLSKNAILIREILRDYFDQIIYYLGNQIGIYISDAMAENMLKLFVNGKRWQYPWITINNLPFIFAYLSWARPFYGALIQKGSWLYENMSQYKNAKFEDYNKNYVKLIKSSTKFFKPTFCFMHHERSMTGEEFKETILFRVDDDKELFSCILEISENAFVNLLAASDTKRTRKEKLLAISKKYLK